MQNKYRILVTGATGLCGKNIVDYFQRNSNYEVFLTSRKFNDTQNKIKCDLTKFSNIKKLPRKVNCIIHCAATVNEKEQNFEIIKNNLLIMHNLLEYANDVSPNCIINLSSISVYGYPDKKNINEKSPVTSSSYYAYSKIINEIMLEKFSSEKSRIVNLRLGYVLAKTIPQRYIISKILDNLKKNHQIMLFEPKNNFFNFIDIDDISKICLKIINSKISGTFNVVGEKQPTLDELMKEIKFYFPKSLSKIITKKSNQINQSTYSNKKIKKILKIEFTSYKKTFSKIIENMS